MANILVGTLGRGKELGKKDYDLLTYVFDETHRYTATFFAIALSEYYKEIDRRLDKMVILGTSSSMWDALLLNEHLYSEHNFDESLADRLCNAIHKKEVNQDILEAVSKQLTQNANGMQIICKLIPHGINEQEQSEILKTIADCVNENDEVTLDVTHGFRSMPIIELLAVYYLRSVKKINVQGIYYGAADMKNRDTNEAPVIRLDFAMKMFEWLQALPLVQKMGQFDSIADLLDNNQTAIRKNLKTLDFYLAMNQIGKAGRKAENIYNGLNVPFNEDISAELFRQTLQKRLQWSLEDSLAVKQLKCARYALEQGDYLRCAILMREARITMAIPSSQREHQEERDIREQVNEELNAKSTREDAHLMKIRNALAHATPLQHTSKTNGYVISLMENKEKLIAELSQLLEHYTQQLASYSLRE